MGIDALLEARYCNNKDKYVQIQDHEKGVEIGSLSDEVVLLTLH